MRLHHSEDNAIYRQTPYSPSTSRHGDGAVAAGGLVGVVVGSLIGYAVDGAASAALGLYAGGIVGFGLGLGYVRRNPARVADATADITKTLG